MNINENVHIWDLKEIIDNLVYYCGNIKEVYLFGSRGYRTNSLRSDIDLLIVCDTNEDMLITEPELIGILEEKYPIVDIFFCDRGSARSINNGSKLRLREGYANLIEQVDAVLLWSEENKFVQNDKILKQKAIKDYNFEMTVIPSYAFGSSVSEKIVKKAIQKLEHDNEMDYFFTGLTSQQISYSIVDIIRRGFSLPNNYQKKAKDFSFDKIKITNEYDFQNFIHLLLKPIFPKIECEPFTVKFDGNEKFADFSVCGGKIVIEAKWIDSASKKNEVLKTLDGLTNFYKQHPNVESLIFLLLYDANIDIDESKIYTRRNISKGIFLVVECIENIYK